MSSLPGAYTATSVSELGLWKYTKIFGICTELNAKKVRILQPRVCIIINDKNNLVQDF